MVRKFTLTLIPFITLAFIASCTIHTLNFQEDKNNDNTNKNNNNINVSSLDLYGLSFPDIKLGTELLIIQDGKAEVLDLCEGTIEGKTGPEICSSNPQNLTNVDKVLFLKAELKTIKKISAALENQSSYLVRVNQNKTVEVISTVQGALEMPVVYDGYLYFTSRAYPDNGIELFRIKSDGKEAEVIHHPVLAGDLVNPNMYNLFIKDNALYFVQRFYDQKAGYYQAQLCRIKIDEIGKGADCSKKLTNLKDGFNIDVRVDKTKEEIIYFENTLFITDENDVGAIFTVKIPALDKTMQDIKVEAKIDGIVNSDAKKITTEGDLYVLAVKPEPYIGRGLFIVNKGETKAKLINDGYYGEPSNRDFFTVGSIAYIRSLVKEGDKAYSLLYIDKASLKAKIIDAPDVIRGMKQTKDGIFFTGYYSATDTSYRLFNIPVAGGAPVEIAIGDNFPFKTGEGDLAVMNDRLLFAYLFQFGASAKANLYFLDEELNFTPVLDDNGALWETELDG